MKLTTYNGIDIHVDDEGAFFADIAGHQETGSIEKVKAAIDKSHKKPLNEPILNIHQEWYSDIGTLLKGRITVPDGLDLAWYIMENGTRGKERKFYQDNPDNLNKMKRIIELISEIGRLEKERQSLWGSLEIVDLPKLIKERGEEKK